jgi:hypothetical protein
LCDSHGAIQPSLFRNTLDGTQIAFDRGQKIGIRPSGDFEQKAYEYLRDHQKTLTGLIAWDEGNIAIIIDGRASEVTVDYLNGNFYSLLGVDLLAGRAFNSADDTSGAPAFAVISYEY